MVVAVGLLNSALDASCVFFVLELNPSGRVPVANLKLLNPGDLNRLDVLSKTLFNPSDLLQLVVVNGFRGNFGNFELVKTLLWIVEH